MTMKTLEAILLLSPFFPNVICDFSFFLKQDLGSYLIGCCYVLVCHSVLPLLFTVKILFHSLPVGEKSDVLLAIIDFFYIKRNLSETLSSFHATVRDLGISLVIDVRLSINRYFSFKKRDCCIEGVFVGSVGMNRQRLSFNKNNSVTNDCLYNKHI